MTTPAQAARDREKQKVARLTDIVQRCHGDRWSFDTDDKQTHILSCRATGESVVLCTIYADALPDEIELISGALENVALFLELRRRAIIALKSGQASQSSAPQPEHGRQLRDGDFAANAAILCAEPLFHRFLERQDRDGKQAIHDKDQATAVMKRLIGITSRKQLNSEERAQTAFIDLRADFQAWKERGRA
ncbi:hypothetical protein [Agrobacterium larrymoorei]|uniref:Uncharacterized protein n=1 Tax=Agrobacterium larrymoorei TaxID=160699 RepID=A0AAF0KIK5_9HYPH|nr:hypothetical protein [Agrobacterium larrymoorei]WHA40934.1 hypothetical protein CFBP5477_014155 [Agrobacterium larrymoorei]